METSPEFSRAGRDCGAAEQTAQDIIEEFPLRRFPGTIQIMYNADEEVISWTRESNTPI